MSTAPQACVVIPAHNEESVIARCLESVANHSSQPGALEVIVVANGCNDDTAAVAREFLDRLPGLRVIERSEPGKVGALNAGDTAAVAFPRIYLDADIELGPGALDSLIRTLDTDDALVGSPRVQFDLDGASGPVRAFYRAFTALPYATDALIGLGVYGVSRSGRARFAEFPDLIADDLFVQRLFVPSECARSDGTFFVRAPRTTKALLAVRTRVARGNAQLALHHDPVDRSASSPTLDTTASTGSTARALARLLARRPWVVVVDVATYVVITLLARRRARGSVEAWSRDDSTR